MNRGHLTADNGGHQAVRRPPLRRSVELGHERHLMLLVG